MTLFRDVKLELASKNVHIPLLLSSLLRSLITSTINHPARMNWDWVYLSTDNKFKVKGPPYLCLTWKSFQAETK
jgi:hypothetical protein